MLNHTVIYFYLSRSTAASKLLGLIMNELDGLVERDMPMINIDVLLDRLIMIKYIIL